MLGVMRSRLRGLIQRGGAFNVSKHTITNVSRINQCHALSFLLQASQFGEYSTCKYNELKAEAKESGRSHTYRMVKKPKEPERKQVTKGDIIDLHDLLFTENRDYLIKYKDNQKVKAEHLAGKVIVLFFSPLSTDRPFYTRNYIKLLKDLYIELHPRNGFEIIFVAAKDVGHKHVLHRDSQKQFEEMFSSMLWTAIPFSDLPSTNSLARRGFPELYGYPRLLIVDCMGMVLQSYGAYDILARYGCSGYPFSLERMSELKSDDNDSIAKPSLHSLLASPKRDYVISNKGDKVPIHTLENKVVALYFYSRDYFVNSKLKSAYEEFRKSKKLFEVVLIYDIAYSNEASFWELFKTMPWLALPYNDPTSRKLTWIFEHNAPGAIFDEVIPGLVIFGPHGKFIDPFGAEIMSNFGIRAYPFTCAAAVKSEIEKIKDLRLDMLWDRSTMLKGKDGYEVPFSQLSGKRVIVIFENSEIHRYEDTEFLEMLKEMYFLWKGTCHEFEVIHIIDEGKESSPFRKHLGDIPWLVSCANELSLPRDFFSFSLKTYWFCSFSSFVFFDRDGKLSRKTISPLSGFKTLEFPFRDDGLEEQAWEQLRICIGWREPWPEGDKQQIYTFDRMNVPASARDFKNY